MTEFGVRAEPKNEDPSLLAGLAARLYDATWLLARQLQLGEFMADDGGSVISIEGTCTARTTNRIGPIGLGSDAALEEYDPAKLPLNVAIGAEMPRDAGGWTLADRMEAGAELVRALRAQGVAEAAAAFAEAYPPAATDVEDEEPGCRSLRGLALGRLPDGEAVLDALRIAREAGDDLPVTPSVKADQRNAVISALRGWEDWLSALYQPASGPYWLPERLEHGVVVDAVADDATIRLQAGEIRGGAMDWYSFDVVDPPQQQGGGEQSSKRTISFGGATPSPVRFKGMPAPRWWEFEEGTLDFGAVDAGPADLARMAVLNFALVYGNDFFTIPLRLRVGEIALVDEVVAIDTFGVRTVLPSLNTELEAGPGPRRWSVFTHGGPGSPDLHYVAPVTHPAASETLDEVLFMRDEMANTAWAIERAFEGQLGVRADRSEEAARNLPNQSDPPPVADAALRWRLGTDVPVYWFPLVPKRGDDGSLDLQLMRFGTRQFAPKGRVMPPEGFLLPDEELPREGLKVHRDWAHARWLHGSTFTWTRRRRQIGRGEGTSGLRFDILETTEQ